MLNWLTLLLYPLREKLLHFNDLPLYGLPCAVSIELYCILDHLQLNTPHRLRENMNIMLYINLSQCKSKTLSSSWIETTKMCTFQTSCVRRWRCGSSPKAEQHIPIIYSLLRPVLIICKKESSLIAELSLAHLVTDGGCLFGNVL